MFTPLGRVFLYVMIYDNPFNMQHVLIESGTIRAKFRHCEPGANAPFGPGAFALLSGF